MSGACQCPTAGPSHGAPSECLVYLRRCAEGEGGRARLAMEGYADAETAAYFARQAGHFGRLYLAGVES